MQAAILEGEYGRAIAEPLGGLGQLRAPIPIFRAAQAADGLIQFSGKLAFGRGTRFGGCLIHAGLQRVAVLLFLLRSFRQAQL